MLESITATTIRENNQPWYAVIAKYDTPHAVTMLAKFENYVLVIDPSAMSHGTLRIRSYERFYTKESMEANDGFYAYLGRLATQTAESKEFRNTNEKLIYPGELAAVLARFPRDEAMHIAMAGLRRVQNVAYGTETQQTAREKDLHREIRQLIASGKKKRPKRKRSY